MEIKHSHETGKLSHLEMVLMLTEASNELNIHITSGLFVGDACKLLKCAMQKAYEHGQTNPKGKEF